MTVKLKSTEKSLDTASQELVAERKHVAHRHEITVEELRKQNQILTNSVEDARRASMHHIAERDEALQRVEELREALTQLRSESEVKENPYMREGQAVRGGPRQS